MEDYIKTLILDIDYDAEEINQIIDNVVSKYSKTLDDYINQVNEILKSGKELSDEELDDIVLNLATLLYYVSEGQEKIGVKEDISRIIRMQVYNKTLLEAQGTVKKKGCLAEMECKDETLVNVIYQHAYKILKMKVETGQEVLNSVKKVLTRRIASYAMNDFDNVPKKRGL